uniref:Uncharacterized protein n=1 Tax=Podarcis muralis TaxID=64176 RepID=A0A670IHV1_PODMU
MAFIRKRRQEQQQLYSKERSAATCVINLGSWLTDRHFWG